MKINAVTPSLQSNKSNQKNDNVNFGNFTSSITENSLREAVASKLSLSDEVNTSIKQCWDFLTKLRKKTEQDKLVDITVEHTPGKIFKLEIGPTFDLSSVCYETQEDIGKITIPFLHMHLTDLTGLRDLSAIMDKRVKRIHDYHAKFWA